LKRTNGNLSFRGKLADCRPLDCLDHSSRSRVASLIPSFFFSHVFFWISVRPFGVPQPPAASFAFAVCLVHLGQSLMPPFVIIFFYRDISLILICRFASFVRPVTDTLPSYVIGRFGGLGVMTDGYQALFSHLPPRNHTFLIYPHGTLLARSNFVFETHASNKGDNSNLKSYLQVQVSRSSQRAASAETLHPDERDAADIYIPLTGDI
jgi:hypothetical protein